MNAHLEIMYDRQYQQRREAFEAQLNAIQQKNDYWFRNRVNMVTGEYPDRIYNYFRYTYDHNNNIDLYIMDKLLPEIKQEVIIAFKEIFWPR